ncbi:MAG: NUDIX domain-containing protein [Candidatus Aminicenantes bacterium]|jgi:isopentenyldiphosphate isomerase/intracellular septation protein A
MNKWEILKSLAPGFFPLLVFIAADAIWGTKIGLIVAVVVGILEFIISYIREKVVDKFILLDVGLIVILGVVSILLENEIFFKLKPALIELIFCVILAVSIFSPVNVMLLMSKRYMKNIELGKAQIEQLNKSLRIMFYIFLVHTGLVIYSAFFMSKGAWAFISGGLFYIIFAVYFVFELARNKLKQKQWQETYKDEEWFDIVDEEGRVTGKAPRNQCHSGPGMLHPVVHLHVIDSKNRIFLQKRAMTKEILPGKWDTAVGGHLTSGETVENALKRESEEELGINDFKAQMVAKYVWESEIESELVFMFICRYDKAITINKKEIDEGKFFKIKKIKEMLGKGEITPNFEFEFNNILVKVLTGEKPV